MNENIQNISYCSSHIAHRMSKELISNKILRYYKGVDNRVINFIHNFIQYSSLNRSPYTDEITEDDECGF
jgi:hypothetical protein